MGSTVTVKQFERERHRLVRTVKAAMPPMSGIGHCVDLLLVLAMPIAAVLAFRISPLNQLHFADPWYYTGYANDLVGLTREVGSWGYPVCRFPAILSGAAFVALFGSIGGYLVSRYALYLLAALPLYFLCRARFGRSCALIGCLFLVCSPLFPRVILWEYPPSYAVAFSIAGACLWYIDGSHRIAMRMLAGFLLMSALLAQFFAVSAVGLIILLDITDRLRFRTLRARFLADYCSAVIGGLLCLAICLLAYRTILGPFNVLDPFLITWNAAIAAEHYTVSHATTSFSWILYQQYWVVAPAICIGAAISLRRRLIDDSIESRVWRFASAYTAFYLIEQFAFHSFILETFYYFAFLNIAIVLLLPLWFGMLFEKRRYLPLAAAVALIVIPALVGLARLDFQRLVLPTTNAASLAWIMLGLFAPFLVIINRPVAAVVSILTLQMATFIDDSHRYMYGDPSFEQQEFSAYRSGIALLQIFTHYNKPGETKVWFNTEEPGVLSISSTVLVQTLNDPWTQHSGMPILGQREMSMLRGGTVKYLVLISYDPDKISKGLSALESANVVVKVFPREITGSGVKKASMQVVEVQTPKAQY